MAAGFFQKMNFYINMCVLTDIICKYVTKYFEVVGNI